MSSWMLYGANGYTGRLIAHHALERGHKPLLAGRSEEKIAPLAQKLGLDYVVFSLDDRQNTEKAIANCELVLHAAGPFSRTSRPMVDACLRGGTHYLDITGEIEVFEAIFGRHDEAQAAGVCLLPGVGFDVIPTDCLAKYVSEQNPTATELEIAFAASGGLSPGTAKTALESAGGVGSVRRDGRIQPYPLGEGSKKVRFSHRELTVMPIPWGDIATAYRSTGIANITTYLATPPRQIAQARRWGSWLKVLQWGPLQKLGRWAIERRIAGPDEQGRQEGKSYVWARAAGPEKETQAWLETAEGYQFTAWGAVKAVERVLDGDFRGSFTPSMAFGADFVLELPGSRRFDRPER